MAPRRLAPPPAPTPGLADHDLPLKRFSGSLYRIHRLADDPAFWGRTGRNRFDAPAAEFGVLYAAQHFNGAFIETFGDVTPHRVSVNDLAARGVAVAVTRRVLRLVDLAGPGLAQLGLDARIATGDHALAQEWSKALWAHKARADGIWYVARHDGDERSVALFDRAAPAVEIARRGGLLDRDNVPMTALALDTYAFALLP